MQQFRHFTLALSLALAPRALAADVVVTIDGSVRAVVQAPSSGPFVGTTPGAPVSLRVALEFPFPAATSGSSVHFWEFDTTQSSLDVGSANATLLPTRFDLQDFPLQDRLRLDGFAGSSQIGLLINDPSGGWLGSPDLLQLLGTTTLSGLQIVDFSLTGNGGRLEFDARAITVSLASVGASVCPAPAANSSGAFGRLTAFGSSLVVEGSLNLRAASLPPGALGLFLCSRTPGPSTAPGLPYPLCLGGSIGRFMTLARNADAGGALTVALDLGSFPQPVQPVAVQAGETWYFQAWHRDSGAGVPSSGLTDGVAVMFL